MKVKYSGGYATAFGAVAIGWLIFSWPWLSGAVTIPYDAKAHFQAQLDFLANALHTGQSPFWTHNVFTGSPQIADPQSLIFSPAFLIAWLDPHPSFRELDLFCFLLLAIVAVLVLMIFKDRGWHPAGAVVAALAAAFGGSAIWRIQHIAQIEAFAFFMLCLWLLSRALDRKSLLYGVLSGLAAGLMVISPGQISLIGAYVLAGYTLHHWLTAPKVWSSVKGTAMPLFSGGVAATVLAAGPIILSFLFVEASNRPEIPFKEAARGALHPASLLTSVVPDLYGVHGNLPYWGPASSDWIANYLSMTENMGQVYIGALPILLLLGIGIIKGGFGAREIRFFAIASTLLLLFALGRYTGFFKLLYYHAPGVDLFRRPADATYALGGMAAILTGYLLHRHMTTDAKLGGWQKAALLAVLAMVFATSLGVAAAHGQFYNAVTSVLLAIGIFTGGWLTLVFAKEHPGRRGAVAVAALAAFMTVDLAINNGPNRSTAQEPAHYEEMRADTKNETIAFIKTHLGQGGNGSRRDRVEMVGLGFEWPNLSLIHNFDHTLGYNPLRLAEMVDGIGASETVAEYYERDFTPLFPSYRSTMADLLGLRYVVLDRPIETLDKKVKPGDFTLISNTHKIYVYENPRALPRVMFAFDSMPANFERMEKDGRWPFFDPQRTVLLRGKEQMSVMQPRPVSLRESAVSLNVYQNTEVEISVNAPRAGFVVLNDAWHPWWFGAVDGKPVDIYRANVLFRAVQVPAGKHIVRFEFRPVEGAAREIMARIKGKLVEPTMPAFPDFWIRNEASARALSKVAG